MPPHSVWVHDGTGWSLQQVVSVFEYLMCILVQRVALLLSARFSLCFGYLNIKSLATDSPVGPPAAARQPSGCCRAHCMFEFSFFLFFLVTYILFIPSAIFLSFNLSNLLLQPFSGSLPGLNQCLTNGLLGVRLPNHQCHCPRQLAKLLGKSISSLQSRSNPTVYALTKPLSKRSRTTMLSITDL